jgi:hypothetical protein
MNKKFTMVCASLLLTSAFTVNAQDLNFDFITEKPNTEVIKLPEGNAGNLYHLQATIDGTTTNQVLSLAKDGTIQLVAVDNSIVDWASSLWCVNVTRPEADGQNPIFDFTNTLRGAILDVTVEGYNEEGNKNWVKKTVNGHVIYYAQNAAKVGGEVAGWKFSPIYETGVEDECYLGSYVTADMMAVLRWNGNTVKVAVVKANEVKSVDGLIYFTLRRPADKVLNADEFNSILYTKEAKEANDTKEYAPVQLTFNQDSNHPDFPNVFSQNPINAEAIDGEDFVYLYNLDAAGKKHYLHVDTAYTNDKGVKFLKLAAVEKADQKFGTVAENNGRFTDLKDLGKFALYYDAEKKELYIRAKKVYNKEDKDEAKYWNASTSLKVSEVEDVDDVATLDNNWVKLQNLVGGEYRIITIGDKPVNTKISFGFGACDVVASNKTSIADGVYVFYDNAGTSVLGMPIHENGEKNPKWVKLDTQDPQHMPAFQWVVLKNQTDDKYAPTSRITLTNREFPEYTATIQLVKDEDGNITADNGKVFGLTVKYFKNITPVKNISDPYMGYRYLDKDSLTVTAYGFNYLHPFSQSTWVETRSNGVLTVSETESPERFTLKVSENSTATAYGFEVTDKVKKRIKGLAQLKRIAYSIESGNSYMDEGSNDKYVLKARKAGETVNEVDSFFLKENNHYEAEHYYALVRSAWNEKDKTREIGATNATNKVGVADDGMTADLKVQLLNETRTSAFAVKVMDAPLYRRFNNVELEGNVGDAPDTLRFYEKYRGEYLQMEANENFIVDKDVKYLGIDDASKSEVGLSFIVDTAWVNRGLGYIKPQYLISIDRDDIAGTKGQACTEEGPHFDHEGNVTDAEHCVHATPATPAMNFGWYLVNFQDSTNTSTTVDKDAYKWAGYTRAGFVKAIHYGDKLYVLRDQFKGIQKADINEALLEKIEAANKTIVAKGKAPYVVDLTGDNHKYVTWSMRYINPGTEDQSFLMESMKNKGQKYDNDKIEQDIAPENAAWLKMQNGCLVLSKPWESSFSNAKTGGDDALIFDVEFVENDEIATENESINATEVSVIATDGGVYIKNAAGKNVVVTTILGQIVANEVLTSDNATIAVPAGIAIVSVDGEEAVKVSVR